MEIKTLKEKLCINQIVGQKDDNFIVEEDFVVPDVKPDIISAINTEGIVCIYKKEVLDGKLRLDGSINTYVMYLAEDEQNQIRSLNLNLDFTQMIDFPLMRVGMMTKTKTKIKSIECRVLNGRKINVRAIIEISITVYSNEEVEFIKEIEEIKDIQILKKNYNINALLGSGTTKVYAKDTIIIDNIDDLSEIAKVNFEIYNQENKISYNKILIKADGIIKIMYLTQDGRIGCKTETIPIMGFVDLQDISDGSICEVMYEVKNILIKPNSIEEHSVYVEIELEAKCNAYLNKEINSIQDLYSPSTDLKYKQKTITTMSNMETFKDLYQIREKQFINEIGNNKIYDTDINILNLREHRVESQIEYEGEIEVKFIFENPNMSGADIKKINIPFKFNVKEMNKGIEYKTEPKIEIANKNFIITPDGSIDIKIDLQLIIDSMKNESINIIEKIDKGENENLNKPSIIVYYIKKGDTLWKLAKKFKSTVNDIKELNEIEDEKNLQIGKQLFIPKPA